MTSIDEQLSVLTTMRNYLTEKNLLDDGSTPVIQQRKSGRTFEFSDHLRAFVYSLMSSENKWEARVKPHLKDIDEAFFDYNVNQICKNDSDFFENKLKKIGCAPPPVHKQMQALHKNINILQALEKKYGSLDKWTQSDDGYFVAKQIFDSSSDYKMTSVGVSLACEYLRNVGIDLLKPDTHIRRFLFWRDWISKPTEREAIDWANNLSNHSTWLLSEADSVIWSFCRNNNGNEICSKNAPKCNMCPVSKNCKHNNI